MEKGSPLFFALALSVVVLGGAGTALVIDAFTHVPDFQEMRGQVKVAIKLANKEKTFRWVGPKAEGWVPLSSISNAVIGAVVSSEDTSFFSHSGVDYHELKEAIKKDWKEKRWARGASTLTQQVVKNVYLSQEKTLWRKVKEFIWAQKMDEVLSKSEILAFYLNMAEWGPGMYGVQRASQHYFGQSPGALTPKQGAFLAMLLPSPLKYHSYFEKKKLTEWAEKRIEKILLVMNKMGFIDEEAYHSALSETLWEVGDSFGEPADTGEADADDESPTESPLFPPSEASPPAGEIPPPEVPQEDPIR